MQICIFFQINQIAGLYLTSNFHHILTESYQDLHVSSIMIRQTMKTTRNMRWKT